MTLLTKRQRNIVLYLTKEIRFCTVNEIASKFKVSNRTIRYDLDYIEDWLKEQNILLVRKPNKGIKISGIDLKKNDIIKLLSCFERKILSIEERRFFIMIYLLLAKDNTTLQQLADKLYVSKNTVMSDIDCIENILRINGITLERRPHYGLSINSDEENLRKYLVKLLMNGLEKHFLASHVIIDIFNQMKFDDFLDAIDSHEKELSIFYTEEAKKELMFHILVSIKRILIGKDIIYSEEVIEKSINNKNFNSIRSLLKKIEGKYDVSFRDEEIIYLVKIFLGAKIRNTQGYGKRDYESDFEIMSITEDIINEAEGFLGIKLKEDIEFRSALNLHLQIAFYRLKNNLGIVNPLTEKVKYRHPFIFEISKKIVGKYENLIKGEFPDDEVAYIAMHIGAAFERNKQNGFMPKVLVVCGSGLATSNLLKTRLNIMLPEISLVGPVGIDEINEVLKQDRIDFIVSTIELDIKNPKVVIVNPLLENSDINRLKTLIFKNTMRKQLNYLSNQNIYEEQKESIILGNLIPEFAVTLDYDCNDWRDAIEIASKPIVKKGYITQEYVKAMIKSVEELGAYMVIIPEIALTHASPKKGVIKDCISLLTLKNHIKFGDESKELVKMIIVFGTNRSGNHFEILSNLVKILENNENINKIANAKKYSDIKYLTNY